MNTSPDELTLARWLEDELAGKELADMEAWAAENPEQLHAREELRKYRTALQQAVPATEEPPYADFFLTRVRQGIRDLEQGEMKQPSPVKNRIPFAKLRAWLMPLAACACFVLAFAIGRQTGTSEAVAQKAAPAPVLYTPEDGVDAEWFAGNESDASVIVLQGVSAIPDSTDFSATVYVPREREIDRTATRGNKTSNTKKQ